MAVSESGAEARLGPGSLMCEDEHGNGACSDERESSEAPVARPDPDVSVSCAREGFAQISSCVKTREGQGGLSGPRGGSGAPTV